MLAIPRIMANIIIVKVETTRPNKAIGSGIWQL